MQKTELRPCPFCMSKAIASIISGKVISAFCVDCGSCGPEEDSEEAAYAAWNRRAPGWQPIETAPKDGSRILAFNAKVESFHIAKWNQSYEEWSEPGRGIGGLTHWQPLPAGPEK